MNPGPAEEIGRVAGSVVESLKGQPLSLALVVMNIGLMLILWYVAHTLSAARQHELELMLSEQKDIRELLAKCVVPGT